jgi:hypothetical protein
MFEDNSVTSAKLSADLQNQTPAFKNRIINGAMVISQRGTSVTGLQNSPAYLVDRFSYRRNGTWTTATYTYSQIGSISLAGFQNAARLTVTATQTPSGDMFSSLDQYIEGFNVANLGLGTASAKTITVSFWVRSSVTGTFSVTVSNTTDRSYVTEYSISAANTWEYKTITIPGVTSGTWLTTTGIGLALIFTVASSSTGTFTTSTLNQWQSANVRASTNQTNLSVTNGATWDITGVQLEEGSTATSFDYRPYGTELQLCQRYYYRLKAGAAGENFNVGYCDTTTVATLMTNFLVSMRSAPTALEQSGTAGDYTVIHAGTNTACSSVPTFSSATTDNLRVSFTVASGFTAGRGAIGRAANANAYLGWSAEL